MEVRVSGGVLRHLSSSSLLKVTPPFSDHCWVRHVTTNFFALIADDGFFNNLPQIDLIPLQNGI